VQPVTIRSNCNMSRAWPPMPGSLAAHLSLSLRLRIVRKWVTSASVRPRQRMGDWGRGGRVVSGAQHLAYRSTRYLFRMRSTARPS
jgi:hypothetical protein